MDTVDGLMIVAHPDDDALFGGILQKTLRRLRWVIICITYHRDDPRANELLSWQTSLGTDPSDIHFLGFEDNPEDIKNRKSSFSIQQVEQSIRSLGLEGKLIVTHNRRGEYGHPHHVCLHHAVLRVYRKREILLFGYGLDRTDIQIESHNLEKEISAHYPSQTAAIQMINRIYACCRLGKYAIKPA